MSQSKKISISLSIFNREYLVNNIQIVNNVNSISTCRIGLQPIDDSVTLTDLKDLSHSINNNIQSLNSVSPNASLSINDGQGGSISLKGYASNPNIVIGGDGRFGLSVNILHLDSIFAGIVFGAYRLSSNVLKNLDKQNNINEYAALLQNETQPSDSVTRRIERAYVLAKINHKDELNPTLKKLNDIQIEKNNLFESRLLKFLGDSTLITDLPGSDNITESVSNSINDAICSSLFSGDNFLNAFLKKICPSFKLNYINNFGEESSYAKSENYLESEGSLDIGNVLDATISLGSAFQLPISQVATFSNYPSATFFDEATSSSRATPDASFFPKDGTSIGPLVQTRLPSWMDIKYSTPSDVITAPEEGEEKDIAKHDQELEELKRKNDEERKKREKILEEWSKNEYEKYKLIGSNASVTSTLNLKGKTGEVLDVSLDGINTFRGFCNKITHNIVINNNSGDARTTYHFSYLNV